VGAAVITACVLWAGAHLHQDAAKTPEQEHGGNARPAEDLRGPQGVMVERPASAPPAAPAPTPTVAPAASPAPAETADDRRRAAYLAAMQSGAGVEGADFSKYAAKPHPSMPPQQVAMLQRQDPNNAYDAQQVFRAYGPPPAPTGNSPDAGSLGGYSGEPNRWALNSTVQTPVSPYVLQPGWNIPAFLKDRVNSDLPGQVTAQVASDVCDTPTGQHLLIPAGSTLVGVYDNRVAYGANRLFVIWQRVNFPDGRWLDLGAMQGTDGLGASGLHDLTDAHFFRLFGHALLMSGITAGFSLSQPQSGYGYNGVNASQALSESLGQNLGNVMTQLFGKDLNVPPTITIRPGALLNVRVNRDVYFPGPYPRPSYTISNEK
jgi:type IV secretion system protein VirB10